MEFFLLVCFMLFLVIRKNNSKKKAQENYDIYTNTYPYRKKGYLLSISERHVYEILSDIFRNTEYAVFPKVRLWDIVDVDYPYKNHKGYQNKISKKHVDFVVCKGNYLVPVLVIELDGSSHLTDQGTIYNDTIKNNVFVAAGVPLLRIIAKQSKPEYDKVELKEDVYNLLHNG